MAANEIPVSLFNFLGSSLENASNAFVIGAVTRLIEGITPLVTTGLIIALLVFAFKLLFHRVSDLGAEGVLKGLVVIVILSLALNVNTYTTWVLGGLDSLQAGFTQALTGEAGTIYQIMDGALGRGLALVAQAVDNATNAGWYEMGTMINWYFIAFCLMVAVSMVVLTGGFAVMTAIVLTKVLGCVGPFAICCLLWPPTKGVFQGWISQALTFILQIALVGLTIAVAIEIFDSAIRWLELPAVNPGSNQNPVIIGFEILAIGIGLQGLVAGATHIAGRLGGGVTAGILRAADTARAVIAPAQVVYNRVNPTTNRLDPVTGHQTSSRRLEHIAMGRTVAAPAYRQVVLERMRNGWKTLPGGTVRKS